MPFLNMSYLTNITVIILSVLVLVLATLILFKISRRKANKIYSYKQRPFLTKRENDFYRVLAPIATQKHLQICAKVRLADIIEPQKGQNWRSAQNKIQSKHIDFLLCKPGLVPVLALELDDSTHDRADRRDRDKFVDQAFKSAKLPILHTRDTDGLAEKITKTIGSK